MDNSQTQTAPTAPNAGNASAGVLPSETSVNWNRTLELWAFGALKVPMIFFVRPKILNLTDDEVTVRVALSRRTRNHHGTMYFGAIASAADTVPGIFAVAMGRSQKRQVSFFVKEARMEFKQKASSDLVFRCSQGAVMAELIDRSVKTGHAVTGELRVDAELEGTREPVATFWLNMSVKAR
jgi:acyl-coenzyme A thioesterase PaaI-like protein